MQKKEELSELYKKIESTKNKADCENIYQQIKKAEQEIKDFAKDNTFAKAVFTDKPRGRCFDGGWKEFRHPAPYKSPRGITG